MNNSMNMGFPEDFGESPEDFFKKFGHLIYKIIHNKTRNSTELETEDLFNDFFIHISENNFKRLRQYKGKSTPELYIASICRNFINDKFREKKPKIKLRFKLTDQSLEILKANNIPETIIDSLRNIENQLYIGKDRFVEALKNLLGKENTQTYKSLILRYARVNALRKNTEVIAFEEIEIPMEPQQESGLISTEESNLIKGALNETYSLLSPRKELIFKLTYFEGWDAQRIAKLLNINMGEIYETNRKVKNIFKQKLEEKEINIDNIKRGKKIHNQILNNNTSIIG